MPTSTPASLRPRGRLRRSLGYLRPFRGCVAGILTLVLVAGVLNALEPLVLKHIFDALGAGQAWRSVVLGVALLVGAGLLREGVNAVSNWLTWRTRISVHFSLMEEVVGRLHKLPLSFHREEGVGATMTRLERGIQGFVQAVNDIAFNRLALLVLAFAPLPVLIARRAAPRQTARERNLMDRWVKIYQRFNEVLSGIVTVKSFAMEEREKQRFLHDVRDANGVVTRGVGLDSAVSATQNLVVLSARVAAIAFGALLALRGEITAGTLVAFLGYVGGMFAPVQRLRNVYRTLRTASVAMDQVFDILDTQGHLGDAPDAVEVTELKGEVEFDDVHFAYGEARGSPLINGSHLHVKPGEHVVLQDGLLFNESVRNNIAYGRPHASMDEIVAVAKAANAHDFIQNLPQGYDTVVGERGSRLSMGERQRVTLARSLLKDPPILILDEPTSALDAESESLVHEALMAQDGYYASLVRRQTRGLLPDSPLIAEPGPRTLSGAA